MSDKDYGQPPNLPGFQITGKLGEGGMGAVWRAKQMGTNRDVAIKTVTAARIGAAELQRFALEIEVTAQLEHPNIGRLYESRVDAGLCYYAMELIEGEDLDVWLQKEKPAVPVFLMVMLDVCRAVQFAHQKAIIHRDLKPGNVMMGLDKTPKVVDFGLAKLVEKDKPSAESRVTGEGMAVGTPAYMSPEQIGAKGGLVDTRTDVYALGVMLYEYIVGQHPHAAALEAGTMQLFMSVVRSDPPRPRTIKKSIDKDLEAVIMKSIAREASERYATAGELADDLQRAMNREPVLAQPQTALYIMRKKVAKNRGKVSLAALVLLSFVAFAIISVKLIIEERDAAREAKIVAEQERDKAEARFVLGRDFAHKLIFELDDRLAEGPTSARASLVSSGGEYLEKLSKDAGERPDLLTEIAQVYGKIGEVQRQQGDLKGAMASYQKSLDAFKKLDGKEGVDEGDVKRGIADGHFLLARGESLSGKNDKAHDHYKEALSILKELRKTDKNPLTQDMLVKTYSDYGKLLSSQGDQAKAAENFERALDIRKKKVKDNDKDTNALKELASSYLVLGNLRLDQGKPSDAIKLYRKSLELREKLVELAPENVDFKMRLAAGHRGVGYAYEEQGNLRKAGESYEKALDIYRTQSNNDPTNERIKLDVLWASLFLVNVTIEVEKLDEAMGVLEVALPMAQSVAEADEKNQTVQRMLARMLSMRGVVEHLKKDDKKAAKTLEGALAITEALVKANDKDLFALDLHSEVLLELGQVTLKSKKKEAQSSINEAVLLRRKIVEASPDDKAYKKALGVSLYHSALMAGELKDRDKADAELGEARKIFTDLLKIDGSNAGARIALIKALIEHGEMFMGKGKAKGKELEDGCAAYKEAQSQIGVAAARDALTPSLRALSNEFEDRLKPCE